jgi:hypothetical protein
MKAKFALLLLPAFGPPASPRRIQHLGMNLPLAWAEFQLCPEAIARAWTPDPAWRFR